MLSAAQFDTAINIWKHDWDSAKGLPSFPPSTSISSTATLQAHGRKNQQAQSVPDATSSSSNRDAAPCEFSTGDQNTSPNVDSKSPSYPHLHVLYQHRSSNYFLNGSWDVVKHLRRGELKAACYLSMEAVPRAATAMTGEIAPSATTAVASAPPSYNQQHQQQQTPQSASDIGTLGTTFSMCEDPALDDCTALQIQEHSQTQRYDYHVAYHPSYRVPVLYLRGKDAGNSPLTWPQLLSSHPQWSECIKEAQQPWTFITVEEHVVLNQPWHMLHPCCTADLITALLGLQQQQGLHSLQEHALQQDHPNAEQLLLLPSEQHLKADTTSCNHEEQCQEAVYRDTAACGVITSPLQGQASATPKHSLLEDEDLPDIDDLITAQPLGFHHALICVDTQPPAIGQQQPAPATMLTASQAIACDINLPEDAGDQVLLLYMKAWWGLVGRVLV